MVNQRPYLRLVRDGETGPDKPVDGAVCPGCGLSALQRGHVIVCGHCVSTFRLMPMPGPAHHWMREPGEGGEGPSAVLVVA